MIKQEQHKRFMKLIDTMSLLRCYWYAQAIGSSVPSDNENDNKIKRPDYVHS